MSAKSPTLTVVIGFRDRDLQRLNRCLESLRRQTFGDFVLHLVDYGSAPECSAAVARATAGFEFCRYMRTETRGYPWNRSQALNIGGRLAHTKYIMTTDADMVFPTGFLSAIIKHADTDKVLYCYPYFLPEGFDDWENLEAHRHGLTTGTSDSRGGCQVLSTEVYHRIRGFDEYYQYWGVEDRDMHQRLMRVGLEEVWLNDVVAMYHQWHPPVDVKTRGFMPSGHWARMQNHYCRYSDQTQRNDENWGKILTADDRPVFRHLNFESMSLIPSPDLVMFEGSVYNERDAGRFVRQFCELPPGHALAIANMYSPVRYAWLDTILGVLNRSIRTLQRQTRVDYARNLLDAYLPEFLHSNHDIVADYYLDFPFGAGVSTLLRA